MKDSQVSSSLAVATAAAAAVRFHCHRTGFLQSAGSRWREWEQDGRLEEDLPQQNTLLRNTSMGRILAQAQAQHWHAANNGACRDGSAPPGPPGLTPCAFSARHRCPCRCRHRGRRRRRLDKTGSDTTLAPPLSWFCANAAIAATRSAGPVCGGDEN